MSVEGNASSTYELKGKLSGVFSNIIDNTLTIEGAAADAKATGDAISGKADSVHNHSATNITSGILPLERGGTSASNDLKNAPQNAIIRKLNNDTYNQLYYTATANGAFYATAANGLAKFGTLPVAQGGTGVTTDKAIALKAYPVGAIYTSYVSTSPASLFGGTWTQITSRFLYASTSAGTTGGAATVTLTEAQMPSHTHYTGKYPAAGWGTKFSQYSALSNEYADGTSSYNTCPTSATGSGQAHENMPPYMTVFMWRRTA